MKKNLFDDQRQPMSSWLDKLASEESGNMSENDLKDEPVAEKTPAKFSGITSTWSKKGGQDKPMMLNDAVRQVNNKFTPKASSDEIEKQARKLLMTGINIEKMSSILKKQYEEKELDSFLKTKLASLENEFGKLGFIYVDASLVNDCNDLSTILKTSEKIASVAVRDVKQSSKCSDCNFNKKSHCLKLGLNIVDDPQIKTAKEAKSIINKFASLKYINSYFVNSSDLSGYYTRLASENPDIVVRDFLKDVNTRRASKQVTESRVSSIESKADLHNKKARTVKFGSEDHDVSSAFKQFLLTNNSIRTAKAEIVKRYGQERIEAYLKEAKDDIEKYSKFIERAQAKIADRISSAKESSAKEFTNKVSAAKLDAAIKLAYSLKTIRHPADMIKKAVTRVYGADAAECVANKLAADKEAALLGLTYIDSNLYSNTSELKQAYDSLKRKANTIFQIKEGASCTLENNPSGVCSVTGLKIVKSASLDTKKQALRFIKFAKVNKIANEFDLNKLESKLADNGNLITIKAFVNSANNNKLVSTNVVRQISEVALRYAKDIKTIRRIGSMSWMSKDMLVEALDANVINKNAFHEELKSAIDKSANDANTFLNRASNQYDAEIFSAHKDSDVILGQTMGNI